MCILDLLKFFLFYFLYFDYLNLDYFHLCLTDIVL